VSVFRVRTPATLCAPHWLFVIAVNNRPVAHSHPAIHSHGHHHCPALLAADTAVSPFAADGRNSSRSDTDGRHPDHPHIDPADHSIDIAAAHSQLAAVDWRLHNHGHRCCHPIGTLAAAQSVRSDYFQRNRPLRRHPHRPRSASTICAEAGDCSPPLPPIGTVVAEVAVHLQNAPHSQNGRGSAVCAVSYGHTLRLHPRRRTDCGCFDPAVPGPHRCRHRRRWGSHHLVDPALRSLSGTHRSSPSTRPLVRRDDG